MLIGNSDSIRCTSMLIGNHMLTFRFGSKLAGYTSMLIGNHMLTFRFGSKSAGYTSDVRGSFGKFLSWHHNSTMR